MCSTWIGHKTPFSERDSRKAAENDSRLNLLQMNIERFTANKISVVEQLACKNKAFIFLLQETHCTTADKLVIPNFSQAGSVLSRNHGLATFVHCRMEWTLVIQSPEQSETEWLCIDVAGYKIINVYKPPHSRFTPTAIPRFPQTSMYVNFNCQYVNWATTKHLMVRVWAPGQYQTILDCSITQRKQSVSPLTDETSAPTQTWPSLVFRPGQPTARQMYSRKVPVVTTSPPPIPPPIHKVSAHSDPVQILNVGTFANLTRSAFAVSQMTPLRDCHLRIHQTWRWHTKNFARA